MAASVIETLLARVAVVLATAGLDVHRCRSDAFSAEELPAVNIARGAAASEAIGTNGERLLASWDIEHYVTASPGWETAADALHMQSHAALAADATLATLGRGLRCIGTEMLGESADRVIGRLTAHYQAQIFVRPGDLTRAIN